MLILTRKPGEFFEIGGNIKLTVLEIRGKQVKIRIEAPPEFLVLLREDKMIVKQRQRG